MSDLIADLVNSIMGTENEEREVQPVSQGADNHHRPDFSRQSRKGVPEVIFAPTKNPNTVVEIIRSFLAQQGRAIVSRVSPELHELIQRELAGDCALEMHEASRMLVARTRESQVPLTGGRVGVITAGTSDVPVAEEARIIAVEMGCDTAAIYDVGVAGLHRLLQPLKSLLEWDVDVIIVAAGMDGALPSVVSGLVNVPVIGLPTSVGYGLGGHGVTAILSMLQTCSPGLTVVNIDNGVGAGATAAMIANRMAKARSESSCR